MSEEKKGKEHLRGHIEASDAQELKEVLSAVAEGLPALIKGLVSSVYSEESAANLGKATAKFYKELKEGGIPDEVAIKMTQDYVSMFSKISEVARSLSKESDHDKLGKHIGDEIEKAVHEKLKKKLGEEE